MAEITLWFLFMMPATGSNDSMMVIHPREFATAHSCNTAKNAWLGASTRRSSSAWCVPMTVVKKEGEK